MKKGQISLLLIVAWVLLLVSTAIAVEVSSVGFGNDKDSAIEDAKRNAITRVVGEYIDSRSLVENFALVSDRILTSSSGYVTGYDLISSETYPSGEVRVQINAMVERDVLTNDVDAIQVINAKRGEPRFVVIPEPSMLRLGLEDEIILATGSGIEEYLSESGYSTLHSPNHKIERSFSEPGMLGNLSNWAAGIGAEYVVYFTVTAVEDESGRVFQRSTALVDISIVHTGSYRLITSTEGRGTGGDRNDSFAFNEACRTAGYNAAAEAMKVVLADWTRKGSVNGNRLTLEIEGLPGDENMEFEETLEGSGVIKQVVLSSVDNSLSVYQVTLDGNTHDLGQAFEQVASDRGWKVWLSEASRTKLRYSVVFD
ncbi:MAG TPA: hypothetical protein ENH10_05125 [Bacteroidetes bacterium]|nr:hypothetical protein [Bacteroidota bacterium]HEX04524.1 hypothetical protein [Bacteroidota bacterium]